MANTFCVLTGLGESMFQYCRADTFVRSVFTWTADRGHERFDHHFADTGRVIGNYPGAARAVVRVFELTDTRVL